MRPSLHPNVLWLVGLLVVAALLVLIWDAPPDVSRRLPAQTASVMHKKQVGTPAAIGPPPVAPVTYLPLTPVEAVALNAKQEPTGDVGPAAAPFRIAKPSANLARALKCLADAVYFEAASQTLAGQRAVAQVVLNRVRNPAFPASVCGVVYQGAERATGCQFTFTCDGSLTRPIARFAWLRAESVAKAALNGSVFKPVGYATHYHADWVVPYWAASLTRATRIGGHIFYRWAGGWGEPQAFKQHYAGSEPSIELGSRLQNLKDSTHADSRADLGRVIAGLPSSIKADEAKARLAAPVESALRGSTLRVDEEPTALIPSLTTRPRLLADTPSALTHGRLPRLTPGDLENKLPAKVSHR